MVPITAFVVSQFRQSSGTLEVSKGTAPACLAQHTGIASQDALMLRLATPLLCSIPVTGMLCLTVIGTPSRGYLTFSSFSDRSPVNTSKSICFASARACSNRSSYMAFINGFVSFALAMYDFTTASLEIWKRFKKYN